MGDKTNNKTPITSDAIKSGLRGSEYIYGIRVMTEKLFTEERQVKFPRTRKKRMLKKWAKNRNNYKGGFPSMSILCVKKMNTMICHPQLFEKLKEAILIWGKLKEGIPLTNLLGTFQDIDKPTRVYLKEFERKLIEKPPKEFMEEFGVKEVGCCIHDMGESDELDDVATCTSANPSSVTEAEIMASFKKAMDMIKKLEPHFKDEDHPFWKRNAKDRILNWEPYAPRNLKEMEGRCQS